MTPHDMLYTFLSAFMTLFPVLNPIGNGFIVNDFLRNLNYEQRDKIIKKITCNCFLIGIGSLAIGKSILLLFALAVPVIQLGGGILICKMGFEWLSGPVESETSEGEQAIDKINLAEIEQKVFYPISFPICFGPGSISVIFTLMAGASVDGKFVDTIINYFILALVIALMCFIMYFFFSRGGKLMSRLGHSGSLIINKLVAFFTFCIGIQIIITGLSKIFHLSVL